MEARTSDLQENNLPPTLVRVITAEAPIAGLSVDRGTVFVAHAVHHLNLSICSVNDSTLRPLEGPTGTFTSVRASNGRLIVSEASDRVVQSYDLSAPLGIIPESTPKMIFTPPLHGLCGSSGVANSGGRIFLADTGGRAVKVFSTRDAMEPFYDDIIKLDGATFKSPTDVAVGRGMIVVADEEAGCVHVFHEQSLQLLSSCDTGSLRKPCRLALLSTGHVLVTGETEEGFQAVAMFALVKGLDGVLKFPMCCLYYVEEVVLFTGVAVDEVERRVYVATDERGVWVWEVSHWPESD